MKRKSKSVNSLGLGYPDSNDLVEFTDQKDPTDPSRFDHAPIGTGVYKSADAAIVEFKSDDETECDVDSALESDSDKARLVDLDWLENIVQDPSRLPVNPIDLSVKELLHQWGKFRGGDERTEVVSETGSYSTGIKLSSVNKDLDYARLQEKKGKKIKKEDAYSIIRTEFAKLASGVDKKLVIQNVRLKLGSQFSEYKDFIIKHYGLNKPVKKAKKVYKCATCGPNCTCDRRSDLPTHNEDATRLDHGIGDKKEVLAKKQDVATVKKVEYINRLILAGVISKDDGNSIMLRAKSVSDVKKMASLIINKVGSSEYEGVPMTHRESSDNLNYEKSSEVDRLVKFAREEMTEGWAGKKLDGVLKMTFSPTTIKMASAKLNSVRGEHEGLSGFLYVDAEAYGNNIKACDKGGLRHRANNIPYVLGMNKCASCVHNNMSKCSKYKKDIISKDMFEESELGSYKRKMLASANRTDFQETADLFKDRSASVGEVFGVEIGDDVEMNTRPFAEDETGNETVLPGYSGFEL